MNGRNSRLLRLRDLILLFLTSLFGVPCLVLIAWRYFSRNSVFIIFDGKSMELILGLAATALICGAVYVFLSPPACN